MVKGPDCRIYKDSQYPSASFYDGPEGFLQSPTALGCQEKCTEAETSGDTRCEYFQWEQVSAGEEGMCFMFGDNADLTRTPMQGMTAGPRCDGKFSG